jgi:GntR family transcriptional regulator
MDANQVDHGSGVLPWLQVLAILRRQIEDGTLPGKGLPGERQYAAQLGVSSLSLRRALKVLRDEGWIETIPGFGSRVVTAEEHAAKQPGKPSGDTRRRKPRASG